MILLHIKNSISSKSDAPTKLWEEDVQQNNRKSQFIALEFKDRKGETKRGDVQQLYFERAKLRGTPSNKAAALGDLYDHCTSAPVVDAPHTKLYSKAKK